MTKAQKQEREEAKTQLRQWIKPGDTVYTILDHVSRSGMSRNIRVLVPIVGDDGKPGFIHPNHSVALAIDARRASKGDGIVMGGCGMDMGFHLVNSLSYAIYPDYQCLGKDGKCPSNYHVNHRDSVRCEGIMRGEDRVHCYTPHAWRGEEIPADWPRRVLDIGDGETIPGPPLSVLSDHGDNGPYEVCPTCEGKAYLPNPEGPERWDLLHKDGYALRQAWL